MLTSKQINSKGEPFPKEVINQTKVLNAEEVFGEQWHSFLISRWADAARSPNGYIKTTAAYCPLDHKDGSSVLFVVLLKDAWNDYPSMTQWDFVDGHKHQALEKYGYEATHTAVVYIDPFRKKVDKQS
jgi:hypothetical protein